MDELVRQAMAKWPKVPHCYGWLYLDARGNWRMRDETAQANNFPGDRITNAALLAFIHRHYTCDNKGCWYFQNGPQRVYADLEATPHIARTDPTVEFILHTGESMRNIESAWMTETGRLLLRAGEKIAMLDDRDLLHCLSAIQVGDFPPGEQLVEWCAQDTASAASIRIGGVQLALLRIRENALAASFGYVARPRP
jgi:Protein of unknown function (DUF2946)